MKKDQPRKGRYSVWVVTYEWKYEGETVEAVYRRKRDADKHPGGGDETHVRKFRIIEPKRKKDDLYYGPQPGSVESQLMRRK